MKVLLAADTPHKPFQLYAEELFQANLWKSSLTEKNTLMVCLQQSRLIMQVIF